MQGSISRQRGRPGNERHNAEERRGDEAGKEESKRRGGTRVNWAECCSWPSPRTFGSRTTVERSGQQATAASERANSAKARELWPCSCPAAAVQQPSPGRVRGMMSQRLTAAGETLPRDGARFLFFCLASQASTPGPAKRDFRKIGTRKTARLAADSNLSSTIKKLAISHPIFSSSFGHPSRCLGSVSSRSRSSRRLCVRQLTAQLQRQRASRRRGKTSLTWCQTVRPMAHFFAAGMS